MNTIKFIPSPQVELMHCEQEAIHFPGKIQPHGVLLVLEEPQLKILQASQNTDLFFGVNAEFLIGKNLNILLSNSQIRSLNKKLMHGNLENINPLKVSTNTDDKILIFDGFIYRHDGLLFLELEPETPENVSETENELSFYQLVKTANLNLKKTSDFEETTEKLVKEIRKITDYDRVMIYQFEEDDSGVVIAEDKREELEPFLGLHYPASDIPTKARQLYYRNWLRLIVDVNYEPVEIIPQNNPLTNSSLDLSYSNLRSVSPIHLEYLKNMGVSATLCISLIAENRLWGLIVCHHYSPKNIPIKIRNFCEFIGQLMSSDLLIKQQKELDKYRQKIKTIQSQLKINLLESNSISAIAIFNKQNEQNIFELVKARGAAIYLGDNLTTIGETPQPEFIHELRHWLVKYSREDVFHTNCLSQHYSKAKEFKDKASGLLAISIFLNQTSYHIFWFRPEVIQTVNWGGNPDKNLSIEIDGTLRLSPRKSFELWKRTVTEKSLPWKTVEIEAAIEFRNTLMLALLEFSYSALQEAVDRAEIANRAKSQFLAKMSHELRTPLNAILGFTQLMTRDNSLSNEHIKHLQIINRSGEHLLALINDVLEMSKIEAGSLTLNQNSFDLYRVLHSVEDLLRLKALDKGLQLSFHRTPEVPQYIVADESKLRQVLINLIGNAIKFTQFGRVMVRVKKVTSHGQEQLSITHEPLPITHSQFLIFEVEDTGPGIAGEELDSLFDPFVQTATGRQSMQGSGLGLPISRQFVRLMGGDIQVRSQLDVGTIFTFDIKFDPAESADIKTSLNAKRVIGLEAGQRDYRILVVEDVEENRLFLVRLLLLVGFDVRSAENGLEAIELWQEWEPHLILMDMLMPQMDGYEATRQIKATLKGQATVIIALTANAFLEDRSAILAVGCDDFMRKPFQEEVLFEKMSHHLGVNYIYQEELEEANAIARSGSLYGRIAANQNQELSFITDETAWEQLNPASLLVMPSEWVAELNQAALILNHSQIMQLIEQIPQTETNLINTLTNLVDNFRYDIIIDSIEKALNE